MLETITMILQVIFSSAVVILLIYITFKVGGSRLNTFQNKKYIKILDKTYLSKDNALLVIRIGEKGYLVSSTPSNINLLQEVDTKELNNIELSKTPKEFSSMKDMLNKLKGKKEENYEKKIL